MQWTDVVRPPSARLLRQFAGLWLVVFLGLAAWRWFHGQQGTTTLTIAGLAVLVGVSGLLLPSVIRPIYTGWMVLAFPIGWTVSRVVLALVFFGVVTPTGRVMRFGGRDALTLRRPSGDTYWTPKRSAASVKEYFRQS